MFIIFASKYEIAFVDL